MKIKKTVPYNIRKILPMIGIAGASLMMGGCQKEQPTRDIELRFSPFNYSNVVLIHPDETPKRLSREVSDIIKYLDAQPDVRTIYLVPYYDWSLHQSQAITAIRNNMLSYATDYSPKVRGRGDFNFQLGEASKVPEDSLWYVEHGWTINEIYNRKQH